MTLCSLLEWLLLTPNTLKQCYNWSLMIKISKGNKQLNKFTYVQYIIDLVTNLTNLFSFIINYVLISIQTDDTLLLYTRPC